MLKWLLQWLCSNAWESEFSHPWQQWICHCGCSLVYIHIYAPKSRGDCSLWLRISDNRICTFLPLVYLILISGSRHNLFPINFSHKSLRPDQHRCQTQSTVFPQCHRPSVTPTFMLIQGIHTHVYISIVMFPETRKKVKTFWSCSEHFSKLISSQFLHSAIFVPQSHPKLLHVPHPCKISNISCFGWLYLAFGLK